MLVRREGDLDGLLADTGADDRPGYVLKAAVGAEDLKRLLIKGRGDLHGDGLTHVALAREPIAFAHQIATELQFVHDRRGRNVARDELHAAGGAAPSATAGGRDVNAATLRRLENGGAGLHLQATVV